MNYKSVTSRWFTIISFDQIVRLKFWSKVVQNQKILHEDQANVEQNYFQFWKKIPRLQLAFLYINYV